LASSFLIFTASCHGGEPTQAMAESNDTKELDFYVKKALKVEITKQVLTPILGADGMAMTLQVMSLLDDMDKNEISPERIAREFALGLLLAPVAGPATGKIVKKILDDLYGSDGPEFGGSGSALTTPPCRDSGGGAASLHCGAAE
jgi:hypothetical protein